MKWSVCPSPAVPAVASLLQLLQVLSTVWFHPFPGPTLPLTFWVYVNDTLDLEELQRNCRGARKIGLCF